MESYDTIGTDYNNTRKADTRITDILVHLMNCPPDSIVADIGAGTGNYSRQLAKRGYSVLAIEPSEIMIGQAKRHPDVRWIRGYAENIPLGNDSVDAVVCILATHHFESIESFVSESKRILKPNGHLVIFTFDPNLSVADDWLREYFADLYLVAANSVPRREAMIELIESEFRNVPSIRAFPLPSDLTDSFFKSGWKYPERYLDPGFRNGMSAFRLADPDIVDDAVGRLRHDLHTGMWDRKYGYLRGWSHYDAEYYFISVAKTFNGV
jgi:ubiquinone/menaquinone biosynthesis C-methylase UbiE